MVLSILSSSQILALYCRRVYDKGLTPATSGNISLRDDDQVFVTPTGCCLGEVEATDMAEMDLHNGQINGRYPASSEWPIHRELYRARPDVNAVIHAHPPKATALAAAHKTIDQPLIAEVIISLGEIPLVPYVLPGTDALADVAAAHATPDVSVMLLANHGVIALGRTIREAYFNLEMLENLAEVYILANSLPGGAKPLNRQQVKEIMETKVHQSNHA